MLGRRSVLAGAGAAMAAPAIAQDDRSRELRFIPSVDLGFLDPMVTMTNITRNHAGLVFDQLYGTDSNFVAQPQMVDGHVVEDGGLTWRMTLRDGLWWHDGEKVLARDCVASVLRWARRDALGAEVLAVSNEIIAPDDKTIVFRLKRPYPHLPEALGKPNSYLAVMMPERLAQTDPIRQVPELIGSGPFRYVPGERMQGVRNVYARFDKYVPRPNGKPDRGAGPKIVHFERVVWTTIPDPSTAFASLQKGEHDWWEYASHDMRPLIRKDTRLRSAVLDAEGEMPMLRFNHTIWPFNDVKMRQIMLRAVNQEDFVTAVAGDDPELQRTGVGFFPPGLPAASDAGMAALRPLLTPEEAGKALRAAGYNGEKIIQLRLGIIRT
jgi:peptide/nickel transport system substrate-binding protein